MELAATAARDQKKAVGQGTPMKTDYRGKFVEISAEEKSVVEM